MGKLGRGILAVGAVGLGLVGLTSLVGVSGILAAAGGVAALILLAILGLSRERKGAAAVAAGRQGADRTTHAIREKARRFSDMARQVRRRNPEMADQISHIGDMVSGLVAHIQRDPATLERAQSFLDLHLPKALEIVERYEWLSGRQYLDDKARQELEKSEETIGLIGKAFEAQHARLLEDDLRELEIDRRIFEEVLELDTLAGERSGQSRNRDRDVE